MTKLTLKNAAATVAEQLQTIAGAAEMPGEHTVNSEVRAEDEARDVTRPITAETIREGVREAMSALSFTFHELEPRRRGNNGKLYPLDSRMFEGEPAPEEGEIEDVNLWSYLQQQVTSVVAWKLEDMLHRCSERVEDQRRQIKQAVRQMESGRTDPSFVEAKADFLDTLLVQEAMLAHAFDEAKEAHADLLGTDYETRAMRAERALVTKAKPKSDLDARLARLGVTR